MIALPATAPVAAPSSRRQRTAGPTIKQLEHYPIAAAPGHLAHNGPAAAAEAATAAPSKTLLGLGLDWLRSSTLPNDAEAAQDSAAASGLPHLSSGLRGDAQSHYGEGELAQQQRRASTLRPTTRRDETSPAATATVIDSGPGPINQPGAGFTGASPGRHLRPPTPRTPSAADDDDNDSHLDLAPVSLSSPSSETASPLPGASAARLNRPTGSARSEAAKYARHTSADASAASTAAAATVQLVPRSVPSSNDVGGGAPADGSAAAPQAATLSSSPAAAAAAAAASASQQALAEAYAHQQAHKRQQDLINAELCKDFSTGVQHESGGSFTSPNYPNPYPLNLICTKLIEAPAGHYIVLEFRDQFHVEEAGNDCDNDKIEIRDGRYGYSKVLARYCGSKFPPEVSSTNEAMWLRFISDPSISHEGFKAVYRFERQKNIKPNPPSECKFNVTEMWRNTFSSHNNVNNQNHNNNINNINNSLNSNQSNETTGLIKRSIHSGTIKNTDVPDQLLNYTRDYNVSLECIWNITVLPGWKIYLTFLNYDINKPNDCDSNFIEIYEENLTEENQTVKFCGTRTEPQQSRSNVFNIRHHASPTAFGSKFEIVYTAFRDRGNEKTCRQDEFDCDDGTCIHSSLKCDGTVNCKYRYDESSEAGPCSGVAEEDNFFDTEHMVIILIVFITLVSGMCASIIVSCWGKIQERRRRKLEYHMRKSREASVEAQLNQVRGSGASFGGDGKNSNSNNNNGNSLADRLTSAHNSSNLNNRHQQQLHERKTVSSSTGAAVQSDDYMPQLNSKYSIDAMLHHNSQNNGILDSYQQQRHHQQQHYVPYRSMIGGDDLGNYGGVYGAAGMSRQASQLMAGSMSSLDDTATANKLDGGLSGTGAGIGVGSGEGAMTMNEKLSNIYGSRSKLADFAHQQLQSELQRIQSAQNIAAQANMLAARGRLMNQQQAGPVPVNRQQQTVNALETAADKQRSMPDINNGQDAYNNHHQQQQYLNQQQQMLNMTLGRPAGQQGAHRLFNMVSDPNSILNQAASAQTMPINLAKLNLLQQQQQQQQQLQMAANATNSIAISGAGAYDQAAAASRLGGRQFSGGGANYQQQLTLSAMHRPIDPHSHQQSANSSGDTAAALLAVNGRRLGGGSDLQQQQAIYGRTINQANLSSITCCNSDAAASATTADYIRGGGDETPLLSNLMSRAAAAAAIGGLGPHPQNARIHELRAATLGSMRHQIGSIPRSISAHQLSKSHQLRSQAAQAQAHQALSQQHQQQQQQQLQIAGKSISDAGHGTSGAISGQRHHPEQPDHSMSYPHACTGAHPQQQPPMVATTDPSARRQDTLMHMHQQQSSSIAGTVTGTGSPALPPPPPPPNLVRSATACGGVTASDEAKRAAFKLSRLEASQLTGDTLQDLDLQQFGQAAGPLQQQMSSMQFDDPSTESDATFGMLMNSIDNNQLSNFVGQQPQQYYAPQQPQQLQQVYHPTQRVVTHLSECQYVRRQRAEQFLSNQQQQQHQAGNNLSRSRNDLTASANRLPLVCDCGALKRAQQQLLQQQQQQRQQINYHHIQQLNAAGSSSMELDDSDTAGAGTGGGGLMYGQLHGSAMDPTSGAIDKGYISMQQLKGGGQQVQQQQQHSNGPIVGYGAGMRQQQHYGQLRQQSSELTGEHEDDDDDVDDDDDDVDVDDCRDVDDVDDGSDGGGIIDDDIMDDDDDDDNEGAAGGLINGMVYKQQRPMATRSIVQSEDLRGDGVSHQQQQQIDRAAASAAAGKRMSGASGMSCQPCTCGSQMQLNQISLDDDDELFAQQHRQQAAGQQRQQQRRLQDNETSGRRNGNGQEEVAGERDDNNGNGSNLEPCADVPTDTRAAMSAKSQQKQQPMSSQQSTATMDPPDGPGNALAKPGNGATAASCQDISRSSATTNRNSGDSQQSRSTTATIATATSTTTTTTTNNNIATTENCDKNVSNGTGSRG